MESSSPLSKSLNSAKGKEERLSLFKKAYISEDSLAGGQEFQSLLLETVRQSVTGGLDIDETIGFFNELMALLDIKTTFPSLLADVLALADVDLMDSKEYRVSFKSFTSACMKLVSEPLLKERLEMDTLDLVGLVTSKNAFNQKYVKTKTKLFYKQHKFNLFREENEGYSKLVSELGHERRTAAEAPVMLDNIKSLIGRFNLDPNRVLDLILEAFEGHLDEKDFFIPLLESYPCETTTFVNILGFKFHGYQKDWPKCTAPTPASLYKLCALLLHEGLVRLSDIYPHLSPPDSNLKEFHGAVVDDAVTRAKKAQVISLVEKSDEERVKEEEAEKDKEVVKEQFLSLEINQKLGLCHAHLSLGDWAGAQDLIKMLPRFLPVWSPPIAKSLCELVTKAIEPLYRSYSPRAAKGSSFPRTSLLFAGKPCSSFLDFYPHVFEMLFTLGPYVHTDPILLAKVMRLGRAFMKERFSSKSTEDYRQKTELIFQGFLSTVDEVLLPSLSLLPSNCGMAEELWSMIKSLSYEKRYQLYGHWKNDSYDIHYPLMDTRSEILSRGRYIMKRLTKDNVKPSGRQIGKLSHSNPGIIFDYVLSQIQRYDNFIIPVVDSLKYLTPLAYDVLAYCIIEALGNPQKERLKHGDTNISNWLKGLASFCGNIFRKYPIELSGLLQYISNQLKAEKSFDLLVLKEVIQKMSGIDIAEEVTSSHLEALAGGELLQAEGAYFSQVRNTKKSSQRLREALVDANLSVPMLLLMAQQRDCIIYRDGAKRHLKLVGMLFDNCLDTLVQFGGFLSTHLSAEEYSRRVPKVHNLSLHYHIPADISFFVVRPILRNSISVKFMELEKSSTRDGDKKSAKAAQQEENYHKACSEVMEPVISSSQMLHPSKVWEDISHRLYAVFWSLSLYDLYVPVGRYEEEVNRAKQASRDVESNSDVTSSKKKKELERNNVLIEKLQGELQRQVDNNRLVTSWFKKEKDSWFYPKVLKNRAITQFLQLCVFPRCRFTNIDALYCAKFVFLLHSLHTPNFSTLLFLDRSFSDISYTVTCCTENEARRYGRYMGSLLETVTRWHQNESVYNKECANTPGFISMMRSSGATNERVYLDYENYRHITFKWHFKITKSLVTLLESQDYMQVRNGLIVLTKMLPYYPKVYHLNIVLEKRIDSIMEEEKEKRPDLYALAIGYAGMLKSQRQNLIMENEFHIKEERVKAQQSNAKSQEPKDSAHQDASADACKHQAAKTKSGNSKADSSGSSATGSGSGKSTPKLPVAQDSTAKKEVDSKGSASAKKTSNGEGEKTGKDKAPASGTSTPTSVSSEKAGRRSSPMVHNGAVASAGPSPKSGCRKLSPDGAQEREVKRRKVEETASKGKESKGEANASKRSLSPLKDKSAKKRDRLEDKDVVETKKRKESPDGPKEAESKLEKKQVKKDVNPSSKKISLSKDEAKPHHTASKTHAVKK